jgi:hypothetical protein
VKEYDSKGGVVWEVTVPGSLAFAALRTATNTTLVSCLDRVIEFDAAGRTVWECRTDELPVPGVRNLTGICLLNNGHVVAGCYQAYTAGQGCGLLEISRDKQVAWRYVNPKADHTMMAVQMLSPEGALLSPPPLR